MSAQSLTHAKRKQRPLGPTARHCVRRHRLRRQRFVQGLSGPGGTGARRRPAGHHRVSPGGRRRRGAPEQERLPGLLPDGAARDHPAGEPALQQGASWKTWPRLSPRRWSAGESVERLLYVDSTTKKHCRGMEEIPFYQRQQRLVLRACGTIDPENIEEYVHHGGYAAASKAYLQMTPEQICQEITRSGLRGRGGGGFPTGRKWEAARSQPEGKKYVICNGDEGDPGAFMNRSVMEGNPHSVLEGLMIAARAIGADETLIYVRTEYPLAVQRMRSAVEDAEKRGFLGDERLRLGPAAALRSDGRRRRVCLRRGDRDDRLDRGPARHAAAQAAVPGAERALGQADHHQQRRDPGARCPRHQRGRRAVPQAGHRGFARHQDLRPDRPRGQHRPDRSALRHHAARDGVQHRRRRHRSARQSDPRRLQGRADRRALRRLPHAGAPRPAARLRFAARGRRDGRLRRPGGDEQQDLHGRHRPVLHGVHPARELRQVRALPRRHAADAGAAGRHHRGPRHAETLDLLEKLAAAVQKGSLCGLGKTAPNPVLSTLRHFREEYEAHVFHKRCPTGQCKALAKPEHRPGQVQGLHRLRQEVPGGRHHRRAESSRTSSTRRSASSAASAPRSASSKPSSAYSRLPRTHETD